MNKKLLFAASCEGCDGTIFRNCTKTDDMTRWLMEIGWVPCGKQYACPDCLKSNLSLSKKLVEES